MKSTGLLPRERIPLIPQRLIEMCATTMRNKKWPLHRWDPSRRPSRDNPESCNVLMDALLDSKIMTVRTTAKSVSVEILGRPHTLKKKIKRYGRKAETEENERIRIGNELSLLLTTWAHNEEVFRRMVGDWK